MLYINDAAVSYQPVEDYFVQDGDHVGVGEYFVLGDNRDDSHDSRHPNFGLVPRQDITGKANVILWDDSSRKLEWEPVK